MTEECRAPGGWGVHGNKTLEPQPRSKVPCQGILMGNPLTAFILENTLPFLSLDGDICAQRQGRQPARAMGTQSMKS